MRRRESGARNTYAQGLATFVTPVVLIAACSGMSPSSKDLGPTSVAPTRLSSCIADWPSGPDVFPAARPSLDVDAPRVLWRNPIHGEILDHGPYSAGLVMSGSNLAAATSTGITTIDKGGNYTELSGWIGRNLNLPSSLTTDVEGGIYFNAPDGTYALTADGKAKWSQHEGGVSFGEGTPGPPFGTPLALSPDGILYGASNDGQLRAFRATDGTVLWRTSPALVDHSQGSLSLVLGGAGGVVFAAVGGEGTAVFDRRTGEELGRLRLDDGSEITGLASGWALGFTGTIFAGRSFIDICGRPRWLNPFPSDDLHVLWSAALDLPESYAEFTFSIDSRGVAVPESNQIVLHDAFGRTVAGPKSNMGFPIAFGADGTLYTVSCKYTYPPENRLYAYSPALDEIWHLSLGKNDWCPMGNGVLDLDGVLYLAIPDDNTALGTDVIAIQTQSPGLAPSAWPMIRHDNRGTMWLAPVGLPSTLDGSASTLDSETGVLDAGVGVPLDVAVDVPITDF